MNFKQFSRTLWRLLKGYWQSPDNKLAFALLAMLIALTFGNVYMAVLLNEWKNAFYTALQNYNSQAVLAELYRFMGLAAIYIAIATYAYYLEQMLSLRWRRWMTEDFIGRWTSDNSFYPLQVFDEHTDNPDQRISEDVKLFVSLTMKFTVKLLDAAAIFVCFVAILWDLSGIIDFEFMGIAFHLPGYVVWVAFLYAAAGTWLTHWAGKKLIGYNVDQQRYEADFRYAMMRVRENAESVAFYGGGNSESRKLKDRLGLLLENFRKIIRTEKHLTGIKSAYGQIANIFPVLVAVPRYMIKEINLGGLMQTASAFTRVQRALSFFLELYASFAEWLSVIRRLESFNQALVRAHEHWPKSGLAQQESADGSIELLNLDIYLPGGDRLLHGLNFSFRPGENVLIKGPNGSGKSTLLRTVAGIWPFAQGEIGIPSHEQLMFVAQRIYMPLGTLRDILLYPGGTSFDDRVLLESLEQCGIGHLSRYLDLEADWYQVFSPGEQQRLAMARVFIHRPSWLFLDESTSAMDEATEGLLYALLAEKMPGTTVVSIGHRESLERFHSRELRIGV